MVPEMIITSQDGGNMSECAQVYHMYQPRSNNFYEGVANVLEFTRLLYTHRIDFCTVKEAICKNKCL